MFEQYFGKQGVDMIASFANANEGDVSANIAGCCCNWHYLNGEYSCDEPFKTIGQHQYRCTGEIGDCGGSPLKCIGKGLGKCDPSDALCRQDYESAKQLGNTQFTKALELFNSASERVSGPIRFKHKYLDMVGHDVDPEFLPCTGDERDWCESALHVF